MFVAPKMVRNSCGKDQRDIQQNGLLHAEPRPNSAQHRQFLIRWTASSGEDDEPPERNRVQQRHERRERQERQSDQGKVVDHLLASFASLIGK